jgi:molybdopterin converting factor small subunit
MVIWMIHEGNTVRVKVEFIGEIRYLTGERETVVNLPNNSKVIDLLRFLNEKYGEAFHSKIFAGKNYVNPALVILINGSAIRRDAASLDTALGAGNIEMAILTAIEGG